MRTADSNPLPLTTPQLHALVGVAARELSWTQRHVSRHTRRWRTLARRIPAAPLREAALRSLETKRGHTNGAALFATLPQRRDPALLELLVAYEVIWDYLDSAHELAPDEANGRQLHLALVDALQPGQPAADWYRHSPWRDDGGYLAALVRTCRDACTRLPSFERVSRPLLEQAWRGQVLALNHLVDGAARDAALQRWAAGESAGETRLEWFELSGAASASLVAHALFALAAEPVLTDAHVEAVLAVYWPWISLATTMLDSYVDRDEDLRNGDHSYVAHYPDEATAVRQVQACIGRCAAGARQLPRGERHAVILACMIAMYLSKDSAGTPAARASTRRLLSASGSLTRLLVPILRAWRLCYGQCAH
jgi:tetraprenyl-beta-curcumene synthase